MLAVTENKLLSKSKIEKLEQFLNCIDKIQEVNGTTCIYYKENVVEVHPKNHITITNGTDVTLASLIHFNPNIEVTSNNADDIAKLANNSITNKTTLK